MGRPRKNPANVMSTDLRIPVTAEQKALIIGAAENHPEGFAAWARAILLQAASDEIGRVKTAARSVETRK